MSSSGVFRRLGLLVGISLLWLPLSMLQDGVNTLILPDRLASFVNQASRASVLGLLSFLGLCLAMLVQPVAGALSDRTRQRWGRRGFIGIGVLLTLVALALFAWLPGITGAVLGYLAVIVAASLAQAGQQTLIPDLLPVSSRGSASGWKGVMDIGGAMLGFVLLGQLLGSGRAHLALAVIGISLFLAYLLSVTLFREPRRPAQDAKAKRVFDFDWREHRSFTWLIISRFCFLLGTYAIGRFLLYFVADRLFLAPAQAAEQAGSLLAGLALVTVVGFLPAGWAADRLGRVPLMVLGGSLSALSALLLIFAASAGQIFLAGSLLSAGNAAFSTANWAMAADLAPAHESGRFLGLANFGTAGAAAAAGLFGPLIDWGNRLAPFGGYPALFVASALAFLASLLVMRRVGLQYWQQSRSQV